MTIVELNRTELEYLVTILEIPQKGECFLCRTSLHNKLEKTLTQESQS